jgi:N-acetylmuramoyl-L-alanine amidase CwlA
MALQIIERFLTPGAEHGRTCQPISPQGLVIHYVGNPGSTAENNRRWFESGAAGAHTSSHYIIGLDGEILHIIPDDERAMHAGKSYGGQWDGIAPGNNTKYIGIENCHPDASGEFNAKTRASLIGLCAELCVKYGFNPGTDIFRHYDVSGKLCPLFYVRNPDAWAALKADIEAAMAAVYETPSAWAQAAWAWAVENNITDGTAPHSPATRDQVAAMIYRAVKLL